MVDERHLPLLADQRYGHGPIIGQPDVHELRRLGPLDAQVVALHVDGHHGHPAAILLPGVELPLQLDEDPGLHLLVVRLAVAHVGRFLERTVDGDVVPVGGPVGDDPADQRHGAGDDQDGHEGEAARLAHQFTPWNIRSKRIPAGPPNEIQMMLARPLM